MQKVIAGILLMLGVSGCCGMYTSCNQPTNSTGAATCGCGCDCPSQATCGCSNCKKVTY